MEHVFKLAYRNPSILYVTLHVQTDNEDALRFYKRHGFKVAKRIENYYTRLEPSSAFLLNMAYCIRTPESDPALKSSILAMLDSVKTPASSTKEFSEEDIESLSKRFDELGNFKVDKPPKCVGKCFLQIGEVTSHNIKQLKEIITHILPVAYNDRFYSEVVNSGDLAKLAYFNDAVVGAVCTRLENKEGRKRLYIMMIGTLAPYRRFGVGTMLISYVFALCEKDPQIESVYLHVQSNNDKAMDFYKKFGFEVVDRVEKYYKKIEPDDAYILEKVVNNGKKSASAA
ncbi:hypothetical protein FO519_010214, partial [Halicephalobus sp. NKZ332]